MISRQMEQLHQVYRDYVAAATGPGGEPISIEQARINVAALTSLGVEPEGATHKDVDAAGVAAILTEVPGSVEDRIILYLHGGGYVLGEAEHYKVFCANLAAKIGARVLNVDYRLAPEHPHPAALTDAVTAYRWLLDTGYQAGRIAISGDSAGGGLAITALLGIRDAGLPQPAAAVPISPWVDMEFSSHSMQNQARDLMVQYPGAKLMAAAFVGDGDLRDPLVSPIHADFAGIAPFYCQVGGEERLLDETVQVVEKARSFGVEATVETFEHCHHIFQVGAGYIPESDEAVGKIATYLQPLLGLSRKR
jgi:acetyl esterase/lipase